MYNESMRFTIPGQVPSQKNSKQIVVNRSTGKSFITSNKIVKEWQQETATYLKQNFRGQFNSPLIVSVEFYSKDARKRDLDNMMSSVLDALVKAEMIEGDDCFIVQEVHAIFGGIDRDNPRAEIDVEEQEPLAPNN